MQKVFQLPPHYSVGLVPFCRQTGTQTHIHSCNHGWQEEEGKEEGEEVSRGTGTHIHTSARSSSVQTLLVTPLQSLTLLCCTTLATVPPSPSQAPVDPAEAERLALVAEAKRLSKLKEQEEMQFNEFQQQKVRVCMRAHEPTRVHARTPGSPLVPLSQEKLNYFWIVEKKNLEDKKAELRNKERELQDLEEKHQVEIKVYKQRVKHLLYEHQNETTTSKTQGQVALKLAQDEHREGEAELKKDERALKLELKELELSHEDYLKTLKQVQSSTPRCLTHLTMLTVHPPPPPCHQDQDKNITLLRLEFEHKVKELHLKYETRMRNVRTELEAGRKGDIQRIEDRKNAHIALLMQVK